MRFNLASFGTGLTGAISNTIKQDRERRQQITDATSMYARQKGVDRYFRLREQADWEKSGSAGDYRNLLLKESGGDERTVKEMMRTLAAMTPKEREPAVQRLVSQWRSDRAPSYGLKDVYRNGPNGLEQRTLYFDRKNPQSLITQMEAGGWNAVRPETGLQSFQRTLGDAAANPSAQAEAQLTGSDQGALAVQQSAPVSMEQDPLVSEGQASPVQVVLESIAQSDPEMAPRYKAFLDKYPFVIPDIENTPDNQRVDMLKRMYMFAQEEEAKRKED